MSTGSGTRVTAQDIDTGTTQTRAIKDDYMVLTDGDCYMAACNANLHTGTHVITIKKASGQAPQPHTAAAPEVQIGACPVDGHDADHVQVRTHDQWLCGHVLVNLLIASGGVSDDVTALTVAVRALFAIRDDEAPGRHSARQRARQALKEIGALSQ